MYGHGEGTKSAFHKQISALMKSPMNKKGLAVGSFKIFTKVFCTHSAYRTDSTRYSYSVRPQ